MKAVCSNTAWLYRVMADPGPLPAAVVRLLGQNAEDDIVGLVLDGVLEMESGSAEPEFVTAASADELLSGMRVDDIDLGVLARLSVDALKYAQDLGVRNALLLSGRLYFYNRVPASPTWLARLPTRDAVLRHLEIDTSTATSRTLDRSWKEQTSGSYEDAWLLWRRGTRSSDGTRSGTCKLYVSCALTNLDEAFAASVDVATRVGAIGLKVGRDVYSLLRPDKLVIYFHHFDELMQAAGDLRVRIGGCTPHGVPFTAQLDDRGLLSWGIDPPSGRNPLVDMDYGSWRLWVTNHLASSIVAAAADDCTTRESWQFALHRLAREGVNTHTWAPQDTIWSGGEGEN